MTGKYFLIKRSKIDFILRLVKALSCLSFKRSNWVFSYRAIIRSYTEFLIRFFGFLFLFFAKNGVHRVCGVFDFVFNTILSINSLK